MDSPRSHPIERVGRSLAALTFGTPGEAAPTLVLELAHGEDGRPSITSTTTPPKGKPRAKVETLQTAKPPAPSYPHRFAASPDAGIIFTSDTYGLSAWDLSGEQLAWVTLIGGHKESRVAVTEKAIYARTYGGVFQRIARSLVA